MIIIIVMNGGLKSKLKMKIELNVLKSIQIFKSVYHQSNQFAIVCIQSNWNSGVSHSDKWSNQYYGPNTQDLFYLPKSFKTPFPYVSFININTIFLQIIINIVMLWSKINKKTRTHICNLILFSFQMENDEIQ